MWLKVLMCDLANNAVNKSHPETKVNEILG